MLNCVRFNDLDSWYLSVRIIRIPGAVTLCGVHLPMIILRKMLKFDDNYYNAVGDKSFLSNYIFKCASMYG